MPADSKHNSPGSEEIDLLHLFIRLGTFIKTSTLWLINQIGSILVFLIRKWYYLLAALILATLSAIILNNSIDPYYSTELVIKSNATDNQPIMASLDKLGDYAASGNGEALSEVISMDLEDAGKIKELKTFWYYDIGDDGIFDGIDVERKFLSDTSIVKIDSVFVVQAEVYDPGILPKLEECMILYLESNPYLEALNKQRLKELEAMLIQTEYEINKLDSLQKREYYTNPDDLRQKEGQIVFTSEKVVRMYHNQMFELLTLKQTCERDLTIYKDVVSIVEGFSVPVQPENGLLQYAWKLIWFYVGLAILLAIIISNRKRIWGS